MADTNGDDRFFTFYPPRDEGANGNYGDDRLWQAMQSPGTPVLVPQSFWRAFNLGLPVYSYGSPPVGVFPALVQKECGSLPIYRLTTTNAVPTVIWSVTVPDLTAMTVRVTVTGETVGGGDVATFSYIGFVYRNGGVAILGTTVPLKVERIPVFSTLDANFFVSGNDVQLKVTGLGVPVSWKTLIEAVAGT